MSFSERLKSLRIECGINQTKLGAEIGVTVKQIQRYESGESEPTLSKLLRLADFFHVPLDYLTGRGIFADWEEILANKDLVIAALEKTLPELKRFHLREYPDHALASVLAAIVEKLTISHNGSDITVNLYLYPIKW